MEPHANKSISTVSRRRRRRRCMGKVWHYVVVALPSVLALASLIGLIFVAAGSSNASFGPLNQIYFMRADMSNVRSAVSATVIGDDIITTLVGIIKGKSPFDLLAAAFHKADEAAELRDFYDIGLMAYCAGDKKGNYFSVDFCTEPRGGFWFNPTEVWHLDLPGISDLLPPNLQGEIESYKKASEWMFVAYILAIFTNSFELLVGVVANRARWFRLVTLGFSLLSALFTSAATVTSTVLFVTFVNVFNSSLEPFGVHGHLGWRVFVAAWAAAVLSGASAVYWLLTTFSFSKHVKKRESGDYDEVLSKRPPSNSSAPPITGYGSYHHPQGEHVQE